METSMSLTHPGSSPDPAAAAGVRKLGKHLGAEITGLDASQGFSGEQAEFVRRALDEHSVIVLRDQRLTPQQQCAVAEKIGVPRVSFFKDRSVPGAEMLTIVSNIVENGKPIGLMDAGALWHTDGSYLARPDMYTILYAIQIPQRDGKALGPTWFASTAAAYDQLDDGRKQRLQGMRAIHSLAHHVEKKRQANFAPPPVSDKQRPADPEVSHPVVRTHPRTGRKCLYVTEGHTKAIEGMERGESDKLLSGLWSHIVQEEFLYRHEWRVGDLLMWDNCSTQHLAVTDYGDLPRRLHRAGISGDVPV